MLKSFEWILNLLSKVVALISSTLTLVGFITYFFKWGNAGFFALIKDNIVFIWGIAITTIVIMISIKTLKMHNRFVKGFTDNFKKHLHANWDFKGPWRIVEKGTLLVTGSDEGGITKVGSLWENYSFMFKARIINQCLGVVVRAQDINNYYMFQINIDKIRPHRRIAVPIIPQNNPTTDETTQTFTAIKFGIAWQIIDPPTILNKQLKDWFKVKITVRGESINIYIDDELVFQKESFLQIPNGKVGFRNDGNEEALIKDVRVILES